MNSKIEFDSEFCNVKYIEKDNIVFLTWKKFCCLDDYRKPTTFALGLMKQYPNSNFVFDARNGFEDDKADVEWGFSFLLPEMAKTDCKYVVFIMNEVNKIDEEMDMWTKEFKKYFIVKKVENYSEAVEFILHIQEKIHCCEKAYINCYTESYENEEIIRYRDDTITDMHDHNFTFLKQITPIDTLQKLIQQELEIIQQENKDFIKLAMDTYPDERFFEGSYEKFEIEHHGQYYYLPMKSPDWKTRDTCEIQKISNSSMIDDLVSMDINQDGERLGEDFCTRKARRRGLVYLSEAPLDCYIGYYDGKPIGSCDLFIENGTAKIEEFKVLPEYQRQGFGTTILKYLIDTALSNGVDIIYLTADEDDTPKEMYLKFGFVKVDDTYALFQKLN